MHDDTIPDPTPLKLCTRCGEEKPATPEFFPRRSISRDDLHSWCKACRRAYRIANSERITEYNHAYYAANQERAAEYNRANRKRKAEYESANRERITEYRRAYNAANPEKRRARWRRRRAIKLGAEGTHTAADVQRQYGAQKGKCYWCSAEVGSAYHADHVIPLTRGGSNGPENIVISCGPCNLKKHDRLPTEWDGNLNGRLL